MTLAPWRSPLARALHRNRSLVYARYFQLATIRVDGRPANRTVVFRGFLDNTNQLKIITDARSEKAEQIGQNSDSEACWYFPKTREQFRFFGQLTLVRESCPNTQLLEARARSWQELSDSARSQFAWSHPGTPREDPEFIPPSPNAITPLTHFCLILLNPTHVDHLELKGDPQNRSIYSFSASLGWSMQAVNP
jgi:pyridoxamine 5'-phosphate oxidase